MNVFKVTADRKVFLNGTEIQRVLGFDISVSAGSDPEVIIKVSCDKVTIEDYADCWTK